MLSNAWTGQPNSQPVVFSDNELAYIGDGRLRQQRFPFRSQQWSGRIRQLAPRFDRRPDRGPVAERALNFGTRCMVPRRGQHDPRHGDGGHRHQRRSTDNTIRRNIITGITGDGSKGGAGVLVTSFLSTATVPPSGNQISENSIFGNVGLGIDIDTTGNSSTAVGDGVTANTGVENSAQGNLGMNSPVFTSASISGNSLRVIGYVGSAAGQSVFATPRSRSSSATITPAATVPARHGSATSPPTPPATSAAL